MDLLAGALAGAPVYLRAAMLGTGPVCSNAQLRAIKDRKKTSFPAGALSIFGICYG
jgi:hypothetical protein